jgi:tape measure domain-containing protein
MQERAQVEMGVELARAFVTVRGDYSGLQGDLQSAKAETEMAMKSVAAGALAILGPFANFGKGIFSQGLKLAGSLEQTTVEMETMLGSAEETQGVLERLTKFAVETPFEMPQLLSVTRGLIQFGDRGEDIFDTLKVLGDASGGTAEKFGLLGLVFNQIRGAGRLMRQDFIQLSSRGIISLADIAKHYGVTTQAADKMLSSGKIKFEDFKKIMKGMTEEGGRYANMMQKQSKTLNGLTSTFSDAINITKRLIAEPLVPYLKEIVAVAISAADWLSQFVKEGGEAVSFALAGSTAFSMLGTALYGAGIAARFFGLSLKSVLKGMGIATGILAIGAALGFLISYFEIPRRLGEGWEWFKKKLEENKETIENFKMAWESIQTTVGIVWKAIMAIVAPVAETMQGWFGTIGDVISKSIVGLEDFILKTSEWALDTAEWIQAVAMHWQQLWANAPLLATTAFSMLVDAGKNAAAMLRDAFNSAIATIIRSFYKLLAEVIIIYTDINNKIKGVDPVSGPVKDFIRKGTGVLGESVIDNMGLNKKSGVSKIDEWSGGTKELMKKSWDAVIGDIFKTKKELEEQRRAKPFGPENDPNRKKKGDKPPEEKPMELLKAGMFDIPRFGKSIQEAILKNDPNAKTHGLLEQGNKIQEQQLTKLDDIAKNGGLK